VLDLAEGRDFARAFKEEFQARGYSLLVRPNVVVEMNLLATAGPAPQSKLANVALTS